MNIALNATIRTLETATAGPTGGTPEWLHLLPAHEFSGVDGRGPYAAPDGAALVELFNREGRKLAVDENHSTDLAAKQGHSAPARGWIVELQTRDTGLWGRVEWTASGRALVEDKGYGYLSPVFHHTQAKPYRVIRLLRVALTNDPNLPFLTSLHTKGQTMLEALRKALGLDETADEATVIAAATSAHAAVSSHDALMARIATAAGVATDVDSDALVTAIQSRAASDNKTDPEKQELVEQIMALQTSVAQITTQHAKENALRVIDDAVAACKIVPALRDHMIARHMKNPTEVEAEIKLLPSLNAGGIGGRKPPVNDNGTRGGTNGGKSNGGVDEDEAKIAAMMGIDPQAFADTAKALHGKDS
ncbi:hypothetical protein IFT84_10285 [Rhizobium sp. CFBP 8762]|uniref:phage protease n=1 Tax=Rhizobium sp. CFBP 8762 TaxID=2775279 RepID=UPI001780EE5D|nr:phage protease [Rhizobium sp. CFBP 8762]MBD8554911.1 hypothetical protein [Rhizobium sp. CFBP 8762]